MAQMMTKTLGLAVGISSGANIIGAMRIQQELGPDSVVVTVMADSNKKYLSTDLVKSEPGKDGYLSAEIELLGYTPVSERRRPFTTQSG